jgi:hypothetical protein
MDAFSEANMVIHKERLFQSLTHLNNSDYGLRSAGMVQLREESKGSELARSKLRDLIYDDDGCLRMLFAEALSLTQSHPKDAIPVLETALEVGRKLTITDGVEPWLRMCLGALFNYGDMALPTEKVVWEYLYAQPNPNLRRYAARLVSRFSKFSNASWSILCLLCQHQDEGLRTYARDLMSSEGFKLWIKK